MCQVRSCVPIPRGAALTTHYVSPLLDTGHITAGDTGALKEKQVK